MDLVSPKVELTADKLSVAGKNSSGDVYELELEFYDSIDTENSKTFVSARGVSFVLRKAKVQTEFWPRLLKSSARRHFLHTDFDKWVDEDEQEEKGPEMPDMGAGFGGGGMPGMPGMEGLDFSKLGDMGAGGGMMPPGVDSDDEEDDDMPPLEASSEAEPSESKKEEEI